MNTRSLHPIARRTPLPVALLISALAGCAGAAQAGGDQGRSYAPVCVVPFTAPSSAMGYNAAQVAATLTEDVTRHLSDMGVPVVGTGLRPGPISQDTLALILQQMSDQAAIGRFRARFVVTGAVGDLKTDQYGNVQNFNVEGELRDVKTTRPVKRFKVGFAANRNDLIRQIGIQAIGNLIKGRHNTNNIANIDPTQQRAAAEAAMENTAENIAKKVVEAYPAGADAEDPLSRPAEWTVPAAGADTARALQTAVELVTAKLARPQALAGGAVRSAVVDQASLYGRVNPTTHAAVVFLSPGGDASRASLPAKLHELGALRPLRVIVVSSSAPMPSTGAGTHSAARTEAAGEHVDALGPAETELITRLRNAGIELRSQAREQQLRDNRAFHELLKADPDPAKVRTLRREADADVILVVRANSEAAAPTTRTADYTMAEGWVSVTGYRLDSAKIIVSSQWTYPGRGITSQAARLDAIKNAADANAPEVVEGLYKGVFGDVAANTAALDRPADTGSTDAGAADRSAATTGDNGASTGTPAGTQLTVDGWSGYTEAHAFVAALKTVAGVKVLSWKYTDGKVVCGVSLSPGVDLGDTLEKSAALRKFRISVKTVEEHDVEATVRP